jgi:hypothetical protein
MSFCGALRRRICFCWLADDFSDAVEQKSRSFAGAQDDSEEIDQDERV